MVVRHVKHEAVATLAHVGRHGDPQVIRAVVLGLAFGGRRQRRKQRHDETCTCQLWKN